MLRTAITPAAKPAPSALANATSDHTLDGVMSLIGAPISFARGEEIYGEGEEASSFYQVVSGAVRTYKVLEDGRRQIGAFHLAGDVFGLEAGEEHAFTAEAVGDCTIRVAQRTTVVAMAGRDAIVAADLWTRTALSLRQAQDHMLLLGRKTAEEKVASFLLHMAKRSSADGVIELPMSRQDIADYLGLTIETVSRTFTHLEHISAIELPSSRRIVLRNRSNLQRLDA
jgi:CRP/FNR family nitrogen fixation transcriptional regulator